MASGKERKGIDSCSHLLECQESQTHVSVSNLQRRLKVKRMKGTWVIYVSEKLFFILNAKGTLLSP